MLSQPKKVMTIDICFCAPTLQNFYLTQKLAGRKCLGHYVRRCTYVRCVLKKYNNLTNISYLSH